MQTYEIPRNYKGEGRILYIFSTKGLIYTCVGAGVGLIFYFNTKNTKQSIHKTPIIIPNNIVNKFIN